MAKKIARDVPDARALRLVEVLDRRLAVDAAEQQAGQERRGALLEPGGAFPANLRQVGAAQRIEARQEELPAARRHRAARKTRRAVMLVARHDSAVLLVQRPANGIWGGLWCLPEFDDRDAAAQFATRSLARATVARVALPEIEHSFTHFDLVITPLVANCQGARRIEEPGEGARLWYDLARPARIGLPAPIKTLLETLR